MDEYRAVTMTPEQWKKDRRRQYWAGLKYGFYMKCHAIWWRTLWTTRLAIPYSKTLCRLNLYRQFPDGRCHWCGNKH